MNDIRTVVRQPSFDVARGFSLYVQLPTAAAHEYHIDSVVTDAPSRLHPSVAQKIRDIVSSGELRQYYVRHQLRLLLLGAFFLLFHNSLAFLCFVAESHNTVSG